MPTLIPFITFVIGLVFLQIFSNLSLPLLISDFWNTSLVPDKNTAALETASGGNFLYVYYLACGVTIIFGAALTILRVKPFVSWAPFRQHLKTQILIILSVLICSQTISHVRFFFSDLDKFFNKTMPQKMNHNFAKSYAFAQYCKKQLPGKHVCVVQTDIDRQPQSNLITFLAVRYYVYPLDIVNPEEDEDNDCLIVFLKKNPDQNIPPEYIVKAPFDSQSLIAIRRDALP